MFNMLETSDLKSINIRENILVADSSAKDGIVLEKNVADKLNVTRQTISKWETNQSTPDFDKIIPLCEIYGISADELLKGVKNENNEPLETKYNPKKKALGISAGIFIYLIAITFIMVSIPSFKMDPVSTSAIFLLICGIGTVVIVMTCIIYKKPKKEKVLTDNQKKTKQICDIVAIIVLIFYLMISFATMAWHITWIIWIIYALIEKIIQLIFNGGEGNE